MGARAPRSGDARSSRTPDQVGAVAPAVADRLERHRVAELLRRGHRRLGARRPRRNVGDRDRRSRPAARRASASVERCGARPPRPATSAAGPLGVDPGRADELADRLRPPARVPAAPGPARPPPAPGSGSWAPSRGPGDAVRARAPPARRARPRRRGTPLTTGLSQPGHRLAQRPGVGRAGDGDRRDEHGDQRVERLGRRRRPPGRPARPRRRTPRAWPPRRRRPAGPASSSPSSSSASATSTPSAVELPTTATRGPAGSGW